MKILDPFLTVKQDNRSVFQIVGWWEIRRILYNLIVLVAAMISLGLMNAMVDLKPGEDLQEPWTIIAAALLCNFFYTFGCLSEVFTKHAKTYAPKMFKLGLYFTLFWVFLPAVIHLVLWIWNG